MDDDIDWPDDLRCSTCGEPVGEEGVRIHVARLVVPREPELYAWCPRHSPDTEEEEQALWKQVKRGDLLEQAQSWEDYD